MNTARSILALLFSIALAGCALLRIDASQWDILASIEAAEIIETVGDKASISFSADSPDTDFGKAYRKMLTGHLLDNGIEVLGSAGDYLLNYQVQVVTHKDRNPRNNRGVDHNRTSPIGRDSPIKHPNLLFQPRR